MSNTLKEHDLDSWLDEFPHSPQEAGAWTWQICSTRNLAQDQKLFKTDEGTYYGTRKNTDEDAQSDAGRKILKVPVTAILDAVDQGWRRQFPSAWHVVEGRHGRGLSFAAGSESFEAAGDGESQ